MIIELNNNSIGLNNSFKFKNSECENKLNEENIELSSLNNKDDNYIELFDGIVKSIDKILFKKNENEENNQISKHKNSGFIYNSINEEDIDYTQLSNEVYNILYELYLKKRNILLLKNKNENNLAQLYKNSGLIFVSLEIINAYYKIYNKEIDGKEKFFNWLINDNKEGENIFEIGIAMQINPKEQIYFYNKVFEYIEKLNNQKIIYKIIENRKENIFILCAKEEKIFLFLYFYEKIKKYYPSENPLDIKNKLGAAPLHYSCFYLSREITDILLVLDSKIDNIDNNGNIPLHFAVKGGDLSITKKLLLYGSNKYKLNNKNITPIDYANKYGNHTMKNFFSNNPFCEIEKIKNKKYDKLFGIFFIGSFILKYFIQNHFWKSFFFDIICFLYFLYFIFKKKDYYLSSKLSSKNISIEKLLEKCEYDKYKIKRICPKCKIIKSLTTKHCIICDICVEDFDHHCFWINKCINNNIYIKFFLFLIIMLIDLLINLFLFFMELKFKIKEKNIKNIIFYLEFIFLSFYMFIFSFGIIMISRILLERVKGLLYSNKKLNLEENLLNNRNEEEIDENIKKNSNKENNSIKKKEDNKEDKIILNNSIN